MSTVADDFFQFYQRRNFEKSRRFGAGYTYSNRPVAELLDSIHSPDENYKSVHIAGTSAKGSVSTYLSRMFLSSGKKTGLYTSPHFTNLYERIVIDKEQINEKDFSSCWNTIRDADTQSQISFYDALTLIAILYFSDQSVEWAIFETGLGGRLDSTNVLKPRLCLFTKIGIDHENILGKGIYNITNEKAGILKEAVPAYSMKQPPEVQDVLLEKAKDKSTHIHFFEMDEDQFDDYRMYNLEFCRWVYKEQFNQEAPPISIELTGRLEPVCLKPKIIFDSAHNEMAVEKLYQWVITQPGEWSIYLNTMLERDLEKIVAPFIQSEKYRNRIYLLNGKFARSGLYAKAPKSLKNKLVEIGDEKQLLKTLNTSQNHLVFGSMYLYAAMKNTIKKME